MYTNVIYPWKLRKMDWREVSLLRPSPRVFRPLSVMFVHLFGSQYFNSKIYERRKIQINRLQGTEPFDTFSKSFQTIICNILTAISESTTLCVKLSHTLGG